MLSDWITFHISCFIQMCLQLRLDKHDCRSKVLSWRKTFWQHQERIYERTDWQWKRKAILDSGEIVNRTIFMHSRASQVSPLYVLCNLILSYSFSYFLSWVRYLRFETADFNCMPVCILLLYIHSAHICLSSGLSVTRWKFQEGAKLNFMIKDILLIYSIRTLFMATNGFLCVQFLITNDQKTHQIPGSRVWMIISLVSNGWPRKYEIEHFSEFK